MSATRKSTAGKGALLFYPCLFLFCLVFIELFSYTTSHINPYLYGYDSSYFQTVGYAWAHGTVPYSGFFDNKGPLLFLINMLPVLTPLPRTVLVLFQTLSMSIGLALVIKLLRKYCNTPVTIFTLIALLSYWSYMINGGNLTEEYSVTLTLIPMYFEIPWILANFDKKNDANIEHPLHYAFLDGISFGLISMLLIKNSIFLCTTVFCISVKLLLQRKFINLFYNLAAGVAGTAIAILPFFFYFMAKGNLNAMIYSIFFFNFSYLKETGGGLSFPLKLLTFLIPEFALILSGIAATLKKRYFLFSFSLLSVSAASFQFIKSAQFKHYFMLGAPLIPISVIILEYLKNRSLLGSTADSGSHRSEIAWKFLYGFLYLLLLLCPLVAVLYTPRQLSSYSPEAIDECRKHYGLLSSIVEDVPHDELNDIFVYNLSGPQGIYFIANEATPSWPHPLLTEFHTSFDSSISCDAVEYVKKAAPKRILSGGEINSEEFLELLEKNYHKAKEVETAIDIPMVIDIVPLTLWERN